MFILRNLFLSYPGYEILKTLNEMVNCATGRIPLSLRADITKTGFFRKFFSAFSNAARRAALPNPYPSSIPRSDTTTYFEVLNSSMSHFSVYNFPPSDWIKFLISIKFSPH